MTEQQVSGLADQFARLALVARVLTTSVDPAEAIDIVIRQGMAGLAAEGGTLALLERGHDVVPAATVGYSPEAVAAFTPMTVEADLPLTVAARDNTPIWVPSRADAAARFPTLVANSASTSQAWAAIPLDAEGAVLGVLGVSFLAPREFSESERLFIRALADQCALALARLRARGVDLRVRYDERAPRRAVSAAGAAILRRHGRERFLWALVNASADGMLLVGPDGGIVLANRRAEELFGYDRAELLGESVDQLLPDGLRHEHALHRAVYRVDPRRRKMGTTSALTARRRNGTTFGVEISLSPMETGTAGLTVATIREATRETTAASAGDGAATRTNGAGLAAATRGLVQTGVWLQDLAARGESPAISDRLMAAVRELTALVRDLRGPDHTLTE